jgi:hypothetical protein
MLYKNPDQRRMVACWRTKAWKGRRAELLAEFPKCEWCNAKSTVVNHKKPGWYPEYPLMLRQEIDILCQRCHEHWTKTGKERSRIWDTCSECDAQIFKGRKVCFRCGGRVVEISEANPEKRARLVRILDHCPEVRVGDVWAHVWVWKGEIVVASFDKQDTLPWPMVSVDLGEVGLPAFMFGKLVKRGDGASWTLMLKKKSAASVGSSHVARERRGR